MLELKGKTREQTQLLELSEAHTNSPPKIHTQEIEKQGGEV